MLYGWGVVEIFRSLLSNNFPVIIFIYGMSFFLTGFAISLQDRSFSRLHLARALRWLAAFGLLHGLAEWGLLFIPIQQDTLGRQVASWLWGTELLMWGLSFLFLCLFATALLFPKDGPHSRFFYLPLALFLGWITWFILYSTLNPTIAIDQRLRLGDIWSRYLLALPGATGAAIGLYLQQADINLSSLAPTRHLRLAAVFFLCYAVLGGVVVPPANFFPASLLNSNVFYQFVGLPVQLFRSFAAAGIAYSLIKVLHIFRLENRQHLAEAIRWQALYEERARIARDLHDGAIQSLYAVILYLQRLKLLRLAGTNLEKELSLALSRLDLSIQEMRHLIAGLKEDSRLSFRERLRMLVEGYEAASGITTTFEASMEGGDPSPEVAGELFYIAQEGLSNASRYASANKIVVRYEASGGTFKLRIKDNGRGFQPSEALGKSKPGQGLRNIQRRTKLVGGRACIESAPGQGTTITITVESQEVGNGVQDKAAGG